MEDYFIYYFTYGDFFTVISLFSLFSYVSIFSILLDLLVFPDKTSDLSILFSTFSRLLY